MNLKHNNMRSLMIVSMLCSLACAADEDVVIGDYVIPPQTELHAGIPGDYRRLIYGKSLAINEFTNVCALKADAASSATWTQVYNSQSFQNLRVRPLTGIAKGADYPLTAAGPDTFTVADAPSGSFNAPGSWAQTQPYELVELWTMSKLFPTDWPNNVQVFFRDHSDGINLSTDHNYVLNNGVWFEVYPNWGQAPDNVVPPNSSFVIRNPTNTTLHWIFAGRTRLSPIRAVIQKITATGAEQDVWMSDSSGFAHSIQDSSWGGAAVSTTGQRLFGFGSAAPFNSAANTSNICDSSKIWRWQTGGTAGAVSQFSMIPGEGYIFRLPGSIPQGTNILFTR